MALSHLAVATKAVTGAKIAIAGGFFAVAAGFALAQASSATYTCADTDGGKNEFTKGEITSINDATNMVAKKFTDQCTNKNKLLERFCPTDKTKTSAGTEITCANGCVDGACIKPIITYTCTDTDGGKNEFQKGEMVAVDDTTQAVIKTLKDKCVSSNKLTEYFCPSDKTKISDKATIPCPEGCVDGACVVKMNAAPETKATTVATYACTDTDKGNDIYKKGTLKVTDTSTGKTVPDVQDKCTDDKTLIEYNCSADPAKSSDFSPMPCPDGGACKNGACVKVPKFSCTDTDNSPIKIQDSDGTDYHTKGTVTVMKDDKVFTTKIDVCKDTNSLQEYKCSSVNQLGSIIQKCSNGCKDGACIKVLTPASCTDTDGGGDTFTKGTVTSLDKSGAVVIAQTDKCDSSTTIMEYKCPSDPTKYPSVLKATCPNGGSCKDGACMKVLVPASCTDTDGDDKFKKGTVTSFDKSGATVIALTDKCDGNQLSEQKCSTDPTKYPVTSKSTCAIGCKDGACIQATTYSCTDTDGKDYYQKGTVTLTDNATKAVAKVQADACADAKTLQEYSCPTDLAQGTPAVIKVGCAGKDGNGVCEGGKCVKPITYSCTDSDGVDLYKKGTVTLVNNSTKAVATQSVDGCSSTDNTKLLEVKCPADPTANKITSYSSITCPTGTLCKDGVCAK